MPGSSSNGIERKIVVMGGAHVSCDPEGVLRSPFVDYVVLGEGEVRFPLLLEQIGKGKVKNIEMIDGIGYRKDGEIQINPLQNFIRISIPFLILRGNCSIWTDIG